MGRELPDYAFVGMGDVGDDLLFDRAAIGSVVFQTSRNIGWVGDDEYEMSGITDFFKKVGGGIVGVGKAVGKGAVNAAASRVGLGPLFGGPTATIVTSSNQAAAAPPPPKAVNYTPYIIGGGALALLAVVLIARR